MPSFSDEGEIDLSVVIPAYNETNRLPEMLDECVEALSTAKKQTWLRITYYIYIYHVLHSLIKYAKGSNCCR